MNKNEEFLLTESWSKKLKDDLKSFYKTVYFGPPIFVLINMLFCFSLQKGTEIGFWTLYIPITILSTIYCILVPQKNIKRYRNVVQSFEFKTAKEMRVTLINGRTLVLLSPEFKDDFFKVENTDKVCKLIVNSSDGNDYTIIPDFFTHMPIL